jgi:hypothetical protein
MERVERVILGLKVTSTLVFGKENGKDKDVRMWFRGFPPISFAAANEMDGAWIE